MNSTDSPSSTSSPPFSNLPPWSSTTNNPAWSSSLTVRVTGVTSSEPAAALKTIVSSPSAVESSLIVTVVVAVVLPSAIVNAAGTV